MLKHSVLLSLLAYLSRKETGFFVLDSHAGIGIYDLAATPALRTREADGGIIRLLKYPDARTLPLAQTVIQRNRDGVVRFYPGSPVLIAERLRPQDRLVACEKHPVDAASLSEAIAGATQATVHKTDGYQAIKALLPPVERRGLVFIDPPFERKDEEDALIMAMRAGLKRWATGVFAIWYPIKTEHPMPRLKEELTASARNCFCIELTLRTVRNEQLVGGGLVIANLPWRLDEQIASDAGVIAKALGIDEGGKVDAKWLRPPS